MTTSKADDYQIVSLGNRPSIVQQALLKLSGRSTGRSTAQIYAGIWMDFASFVRVLHDGYAEEYWRSRPWATSPAERRELLDYLDDVLPNVMSADINAYRLALLRLPMVDRKGHKKIGLEHSTVNGRLAALRYLWRTAIQLEFVTFNPADAGMVPRHKTSRAYKSGTLSRDEFDRLLFGAGYPDTATGRRDRALIQFLGLTGTRRSEAVGLHLDDLQRDEIGLYADLRRKGDKRQRLLLTRRLEALLTDYLEANQPDGYLFPTWPKRKGGAPMAVNSVTNLVNLTTKRILGRAVSPHGLRRTFVTLSLAGGASLAEVQRYVGHESPATTVLYAEDVIVRETSAAEFLFGKREV